MPPALTIQQVHWRTLLRTRGEWITYTAGGHTTPQFQAVITRPGENQIDLADAMSIDSKNWDVLIDPADLVNASGEQIIPDRAHEITRVSDGTKYRVEPGPAGQNCFRWSDNLKTWRRVHTTIVTET